MNSQVKTLKLTQAQAMGLITFYCVEAPIAGAISRLTQQGVPVVESQDDDRLVRVAPGFWALQRDVDSAIYGEG